MKKRFADPKIRLYLHILLMLFTLFVLMTCVVAWFSTNTEATITSIFLNVDRKEILLEQETTCIEFPCATQLTDNTITAALFNNEAAVAKTYELTFDEDVYTEIECVGVGMLAYVCESADVTDYYTELMADLSEKLTTDKSKWTFEDIQNALKTINHRKVGKIDGDNTKVKVVYWVEFSQVQSLLESESYWNSQADPDNAYKAVITFTA